MSIQPREEGMTRLEVDGNEQTVSAWRHTYRNGKYGQFIGDTRHHRHVGPDDGTYGVYLHGDLDETGTQDMYLQSTHATPEEAAEALWKLALAAPESDLW